MLTDLNESIHPFVIFIVQAGAVATATIALLALIERSWSPVKRWLQDALTTPLLEKLDEQNDTFESHRQYVYYHLGPNGETTPIRERLETVEEYVQAQIAKEAKEQEHPSP